MGLNFFVSKLTWQIDLSKETKYSLSRESLALLNNLEEPVEIIVTIKEKNNLPKITQKFLQDLKLLLGALENAATSKQIRTTYLDVDSPRNLPDYLSAFQLNEPNLIVVASPKGGQKTLFRYEVESASNPYDSSTPFRSNDNAARQALWESNFYADWKESYNGVMEPTKFRGEENLVRSILEIAGQKNKQNTAYFTTGHGEKSPFDLDEENGFSALSGILQDRNIKVSTIDLSVSKSVPEDAIMLVIGGPRGTFQDQEVASIQSFLNNRGGKLILSIDPVEELSVLDRPAFGLRSILKEWGIRCHDMLIYDSSPENYDFFTGSYILRTFLQKNNHKIIEQHIRLGLSIQSDRCRPVETLETNVNNSTMCEILFSSQNSLGLSGWTQRKSPPEKNELLDLEGNIPIISLSEKVSGKNNPTSQNTKVIVLGSSSILSNKYLTKSSGNQLLAKNIVYWINEIPEMLDIPPRELNTFSISMQEEEFQALLYSIAIIPGFIALSGIFVGWLRKEL